MERYGTQCDSLLATTCYRYVLPTCTGHSCSNNVSATLRPLYSIQSAVCITRGKLMLNHMKHHMERRTHAHVHDEATGEVYTCVEDINGRGSGLPLLGHSNACICDAHVRFRRLTGPLVRATTQGEGTTPKRAFANSTTSPLRLQKPG